MNTRSLLERRSALPLWVPQGGGKTHRGQLAKRAALRKSAGAPAQSKTWRSVAAALCLFASTLSSQAQAFTVDWFTLDGGGGSCTGGVFAVSGTIGQLDAHAQPMTGGAFSLAGGFWSLFAIQTPGAPQLTIILNSQLPTAMVSWPSPSAGFVLQQNTDLNTTNWTAAPQMVSDNGTNKFITVSPPVGNRFYRLFKP